MLDVRRREVVPSTLATEPATVTDRALRTDWNRVPMSSLLDSCRKALTVRETGFSRHALNHPFTLYCTGLVPWKWFRVNICPWLPPRCKRASPVWMKGSNNCISLDYPGSTRWQHLLTPHTDNI
ncbi:hypothetical protein NP493_876g00016 [Ridgeia piscesae]|uniref:Uncharacterized protein n=1 Tax=Ridgeia piscesae TaxID=27915 RepID=A0AAD9KLA6_RIDPI|nr:hypothetical protein NP493_876g00016 [Ridgeia piscesae]